MIKYLVSLIIISLFTGVGYSFSMEDTVPPYVIWDNNSYPDGAHIWTDSIIGFGLADDSSGVAATWERGRNPFLNLLVTTQSGGITTKTRKNTEDCNHETHEKHETYERYGTFF